MLAPLFELTDEWRNAPPRALQTLHSGSYALGRPPSGRHRPLAVTIAPPSASLRALTAARVAAHAARPATADAVARGVAGRHLFGTMRILWKNEQPDSTTEAAAQIAFRKEVLAAERIISSAGIAFAQRSNSVASSDMAEQRFLARSEFVATADRKVSAQRAVMARLWQAAFAISRDHSQAANGSNLLHVSLSLLARAKQHEWQRAISPAHEISGPPVALPDLDDPLLYAAMDVSYARVSMVAKNRQAIISLSKLEKTALGVLHQFRDFQKNPERQRAGPAYRSCNVRRDTGLSIGQAKSACEYYVQALASLTAYQRDSLTREDAIGLTVLIRSVCAALVDTWKFSARQYLEQKLDYSQLHLDQLATAN